MLYQLGRVRIDLRIVNDEGRQYIALLGLQSAGDTPKRRTGLGGKFSNAYRVIKPCTTHTIDSWGENAGLSLYAFLNFMTCI